MVNMRSSLLPLPPFLPYLFSCSSQYRYHCNSGLKNVMLFDLYCYNLYCFLWLTDALWHFVSYVSHIWASVTLRILQNFNKNVLKVDLRGMSNWGIGADCGWIWGGLTLQGLLPANNGCLDLNNVVGFRWCAAWCGSNNLCSQVQ